MRTPDAGTAAAEPLSRGAATLPASFAVNLEAFSSRTALIGSDGTSVSYAELARLADAAAAEYPAAATLVLLEMRSDLAAVVQYLAALRGGHPVILTADAASEAGQRIAATYRAWLPGTPHPASPPAVHPDLAVLLSTSGTTGSPKLVRLSHANVEANARSIAEYLGIGRDARAITSLPLHYSYGLSVLNSHLAAGASVVLTETPVNAPEFWALFEAQAVTSIAGVPFSYELFERMGLRDRALPSLRTMTQAGGRLPAELVRRYAEWTAARGVRFFVMYGATEATARMAYLPPEQALSHSDCIGVPIPSGSFTLRGGEGFAPGVGELVYAGPNVMMGYAEAAADLDRGAELSELATGDLAERTEAGLFRIVGRLSRFSKLFGLRVGHDEVERQLGSEGVAAVVTGNDRHVAVAVTGAAPPDLAARLAERYKLPVASFTVVALPELPRLASGKPDCGAVQRAADAALERAAAADTSIDAVFAASFPGVAIGEDDSFVSLGGDSLSYVKFSIALEDLLGYAPPNWEEATLAQLRALKAAPPPKRAFPSLESDILVRAAAICGVVMLHAGLGRDQGVGVGGGAPLLLILFGYNLARFQRSRLISTTRWSVLRAFFVRIIVPYYVIMLGYSLVKHEVSVPSLLLVSNYGGRFGSLLEPYWFLETILQNLVFVVALFAIPPVRRLAEARPVRFGLALLAFAAALKLAGAAMLDQTLLQHRTFDATFIYIAVGWTAWTVRDRWAKLALLALCLGLSLSDWSTNLSHLEWMAAGMALLLFVPRIPLPTWIAAPIAVVAAASFYIYLTHIFVIHFSDMALDPDRPLASTIAAILVGIATWKLTQLASARIAERRHRAVEPAD